MNTPIITAKTISPNNCVLSEAASTIFGGKKRNKTPTMSPAPEFTAEASKFAPPNILRAVSAETSPGAIAFTSNNAKRIAIRPVIK